MSDSFKACSIYLNTKVVIVRSKLHLKCMFPMIFGLVMRADSFGARWRSVLEAAVRPGESETPTIIHLCIEKLKMRSRLQLQLEHDF